MARNTTSFMKTTSCCNVPIRPPKLNIGQYPYRRMPRNLQRKYTTNWKTYIAVTKKHARTVLGKDTKQTSCARSTANVNASLATRCSSSQVVMRFLRVRLTVERERRKDSSTSQRSSLLQGCIGHDLLLSGTSEVISNIRECSDIVYR